MALTTPAKIAIIVIPIVYIFFQATIIFFIIRKKRRELKQRLILAETNQIGYKQIEPRDSVWSLRLDPEYGRESKDGNEVVSEKAVGLGVVVEVVKMPVIEEGGEKDEAREDKGPYDPKTPQCANDFESGRRSPSEDGFETAITSAGTSPELPPELHRIHKRPQNSGQCIMMLNNNNI
ncbi:hypothetical protein P154DRAFT_582377 [Amniculicola lignicola CBS 123094]|uniref:Uncharacterized protein n=1 Tax=Amniculicola lignicola CBS 123094 TaxID=1392246 RepID=A0A6A5W113_9PLEO|nr:hypothetical protein P154DRAFT_582377 [Amniculicola lignicola CBS 123094]